jgi:class 3 adenylate cyclase
LSDAQNGLRVVPHFIDIHELPGVTSEIAAAEHIRDIEVQGPQSVNYSKYWLNEETGRLFCYCEAPTAEAAIEVHRLAHGVPADKLIEVTPELMELFLGAVGFVDKSGAVLISEPGGNVHDTAIRTILFTDIVDSTSLTQRLGDEAAMAIIAAHDQIVRQALADNRGHEVKHTGDGIMAVFVSSVGAVRCAVQAQREVSKCVIEAIGEPIRIRIGIAAGEPVGHNNDLFGATVQLAARLCAHAGTSQIFVSSAVADLCHGKRLHFEDVATLALQGFPREISARFVVWQQ